MRSLLTPFRLIVLAVSLSLFTFIWTFALPPELPQPVLPILDHDRPQAHNPVNLEKQAPAPAPVVTSAHRVEPVEAQEPVTSSRDDLTTTPKSTLTPTPTPLSSHSSPISSHTDEKPKFTTTAGKQESASSAVHQHSTNTTLAAAPYLTGQNGTAYTNGTRSEIHCKGVHGASKIMIIVKTSKAEIQDKLPVQLDNLLSCVPHFAIFSDHSGVIGNHTVYDALEGVTGTAKATYDELKAYVKSRGPDAKPGALPKALDKWKMLPMIYKAYKMRPQTRFFVVIETDSSLSWTNLLQWTDRLDYRIQYYAGAPLQIGTLKFAQRGPGILLSNAALKQFVKAYDELYEAEWEKRVDRECCGDVVLASTMGDAHVELYKAFPQFQAEDPASIDWMRERWCTPAVSWHNMTQAKIEEAWGFERNWTKKYGWEEPILMADAFTGLIKPLLNKTRDEWDNDSQGTKIMRPQSGDLSDKDSQEWFKLDEDIRQAVTSWESCQKVCEALKDCQQWKYSKKGEGECHLGKNIKLGWKAPKKDTGELWTSGWIAERIYNTTREWECEEPNWRFNQ